MLRSCTIVLVSLVACGDAGVPLAEAPSAFASAYCERVFACCEPVELDALFPDGAVGDRATCEVFVARVFGNEFIDDTRRSQAGGRATYDPAAMAACLEHLRADRCTHLAQPLRRMTFPAECAPVRLPRVAVAGECDHDFQCETGACASAGDDASGQCTEVPALGAPCPTGDCGPAAFCDRSGPAEICAPINPDGGACTSDLGCESLECLDGVCVPPTLCDGA